MSEIERIFDRTMRSKAAIDAAQAVMRFHELVSSDEDPTTAFLQVFCGVYYLLPPEPRPDYITTVGELYAATKDAYAHVTKLKAEAEEAMAFLKGRMKHEK